MYIKYIFIIYKIQIELIKSKYNYYFLNIYIWNNNNYHNIKLKSSYSEIQELANLISSHDSLGNNSHYNLKPLLEYNMLSDKYNPLSMEKHPNLLFNFGIQQGNRNLNHL
jgi:hypothetical protein